MKININRCRTVLPVILTAIFLCMGVLVSCGMNGTDGGNAILNVYAMSHIPYNEILGQMGGEVPDGKNNSGISHTYRFEYVCENGSVTTFETTVDEGETFDERYKLSGIKEGGTMNVSIISGSDGENSPVVLSCPVMVYYPYVVCDNVNAFPGKHLALNESVMEVSWGISGEKVSPKIDFLGEEPFVRCDFETVDGGEFSYVYSPSGRTDYNIRIFIGTEDVTQYSFVLGNRNRTDIDVNEDCDFYADISYFQLLLSVIVSNCSADELAGRSVLCEITRDDGEVFYEVLSFDGTSTDTYQYIKGLRAGTYTARIIDTWSLDFTSESSEKATGVADNCDYGGNSLTDGEIYLGTEEGERTTGVITFYCTQADEEYLEMTDKDWYVFNDIGSEWNE